jgi:signal transduction histidine kinase
VDRARRGAAFTTSDGEGSRVLLPVVVADGTAVVRTSVTEDDLRRGVPGAWAGIVGLGVLLLVLAFAIASWFGRRISAPVLEVAGTAHRLREGDLSARAEPRGPEETRELASALNRLAERTGELLAHERAAVGDLSHRLRTPVTALRLDAETVPDPELAGRLQQHIAVLQRTIDAIVRDARRPVRRDLPAVSDATAVVADRVAFWQPLADEQQRQMDVVLPGEPLRVRLESDELSDLVDVVADNVFAHTPDGTALRVELRREGDHHLVLLVTDSGPGFPPGGRSERTGSTGLGLDIVRRAVHGAGGTMRLASTPSGGALVEVVLPLERA